jgi:hypothetical protein
MRRTLSFAAASAVALLALAAAPAAHADQVFTGSITDADPVLHITEPDDPAEKCALADGGSADLPVDTVNLTAQVAGNRRFIVSAGDHGPVVYVFRNGVCVGADYTPDNESEATGKIVDVDKVAFAAGDRITVKIALFEPGDWKLTVVQPEPVKGAANAPVVGRGAPYVALPASVSCSSHTATLKLTKKAQRKAVKAVVRANGAKVKTIKSFKRKSAIVRGLPAATTKLSVDLTLENGKKVHVQRSYWSC